MKIRPYDKIYKTAFIQLYQTTFLNSPVYQEVWTDEQVEDVLDSNETYLLLEENKQLAGFICGKSYLDIKALSDIEASVISDEHKAVSLYISELVIGEAFRGEGNATKLLEYFLSKKTAQGISHFLIHTRLNNPVRSLYERFGFAPISDSQGNIMESKIEATTKDGTNTYKGLYLYLRKLPLKILADTFNIYQLKATSSIETSIFEESFFSLTKTKDEITLICKDSYQIEAASVVDEDTKLKALKVDCDVSSISGVLASLVNPLGKAGIGVYGLSSFETDYVFISEKHIEKAKILLQHRFKIS